MLKYPKINYAKLMDAEEMEKTERTNKMSPNSEGGLFWDQNSKNVQKSRPFSPLLAKYIYFFISLKMFTTKLNC